MRRLEAEWGMRKNHPLFPPGHFTLGLNLLYGYPPGPPVPFIVPHACVMDYIVIYPPTDRPEDVQAEIAGYLDGVFDQDPWLREHRPTLEWMHQWPAYDTPVEHPVIGALSAAHERVLGRAAVIQGIPGGR